MIELVDLHIQDYIRMCPIIIVVVIVIGSKQKNVRESEISKYRARYYTIGSLWEFKEVTVNSS